MCVFCEARVLYTKDADTQPTHAATVRRVCGTFIDMQATTLRLLKTLLLNVRRHWEVRLRAIPPSSPLANPNTLVFMMDRTLNEVFHQPARKKHVVAERQLEPLSPHHRAELCACGLNPLLAYFETAERALNECGADLQSEFAPDLREEFDQRLSQAKRNLALIAQREVESLCGSCRRRSDRDADLSQLSPKSCAGKPSGR